MKSAHEEISIKVTIADRVYPLKIDASEEAFIRRAAKLINDKTKFYNENFSVKDKQDTLAMTALEFASDLLSSNEKSGEDLEVIDSKITQLHKLIDKVMHWFTKFYK